MVGVRVTLKLEADIFWAKDRMAPEANRFNSFHFFFLLDFLVCLVTLT